MTQESAEEVIARAAIVWMDVFGCITGRSVFPPSPSTAEWGDYSTIEQNTARLVAVAALKALAAAGYEIRRPAQTPEGWQPIETCPRDCPILVWGQPTDIEGLRFTAPGVHAAYWDQIDSSFCIKGATWLGPFIKPTHWQPLPLPPTGGKP